jgi:hypothetical protein
MGGGLENVSRLVRPCEVLEQLAPIPMAAWM